MSCTPPNSSARAPYRKNSRFPLGNLTVIRPRTRPLKKNRIVNARPNNSATCKGRFYSPPGPWEPGPGNGRIELRIYNSNAFLDDAWDIYVNGQFAFNYDGGSETSLTWSADLPGGLYTFEGRFSLEQSDNFFSWEVKQDGEVIAEGDSPYLSGEPGDVLPLGSFTVT